MAEDKRSFLLRTSYLHRFEKMTDQELGKLMKHLLRYVNDLNPVAPDRITEIAFEAIEGDLKEDLKKWEGVRAVRAETGRVGGIKSAENRKIKAELKRLQAEKEANQAIASNQADFQANQAVYVYVNNINIIIQREDFENQVLRFFGFEPTPQNISHQRSISDFCKVQFGKGDLNYFAQQFTDYSTYLQSAKKMQYRFALENYIGSQNEAWLNGKWNKENWSLKLKEFLSSQNPMSQKAIDQSNNKDFLNG
jgi:hypothetical protein